MGEVRVFYAQGAPPSRGAISPAPSPSYLTQDRRALAGFGQAISQQGAAFLDHIQRVDVFNQTTEIEGATTESYSNFLNNLATDPDPSSYLSKYGEWSKVEQKNIDAMKNPESRRRAKGWFNKQSASWYNQVQSNATGRVIRDSKAAFTLGIDRAIRDRDPDALARATTKAFQSGATGENEAALVLERGLEDIAVGRMNDLIEADPDEALIAIDESTEIPSERKSVLRSRANTRINQIEANVADELEIAREADRDTISKIIRAGQPAGPTIEGSNLDEKEQFTWFERERAESERRIKGISIVTNQSIKGDLESMAYNIPNGSVAIGDFQDELDAARYDNKTIDDSAYDELRTLATREFKTYQSNEMGSRINFARNQLVTTPSDLGFEERIRKITDAFQKEQAISLRKLELDNLDQYRKALNDWFGDNPEADADEIYEKGRNLLAYYRKTPEQLRKEQQQRITPSPIQEAHTPQKVTESEFTPAGTPRKIEKEGLPRPKNKAEYDKLKSGTKYIAPDGTERTKG